MALIFLVMSIGGLLGPPFGGAQPEPFLGLCHEFGRILSLPSPIHFYA